MQSFLLILALFAIGGQWFIPMLTVVASDYDKCEEAKPVKKHSFLDLAGGKYYIRAISRDYDQIYDYLKTLDSIIYYFDNTNETDIYDITITSISKSLKIKSDSFQLKLTEETAKLYKKLVAYKHHRYALLYKCAPPPYRFPWSTVDRMLLSTKLTTKIGGALLFDLKQEMDKHLIQLPFEHVKLIDNQTMHKREDHKCKQCKVK